MRKLVLILALLLISTPSWAIDKFARGGGGNWTTDATWSTTSGGAADTTAPTSTDAAILDGNSGAVNVDATSVAQSLDCTGYISTLAFSTNDVLTVSGSVTFVSGMTLTMSAVSGATLTMAATGSLTTAGKSLRNLIIDATGGTVTLVDGVTTVSANITVTNGTIKMDGAADNSGLIHSINGLTSSNTNTRTITMGNSTVSLNSSSAPLTFANGTLTFNAGTSTLIVTDTGAGTKTFAGGGHTFATVQITGSGTGQVTFTGNNTYANLPQVVSGTKTIGIASGSTQTFTGGTDFGNGTNRVTITSATQHTLSKSSGVVNAGYLTLTNSSAIGGAVWNCLNNCVDNGGNSGWIFPSAGRSGSGRNRNIITMAPRSRLIYAP